MKLIHLLYNLTERVEPIVLKMLRPLLNPSARLAITFVHNIGRLQVQGAMIFVVAMLAQDSIEKLGTA